MQKALLTSIVVLFGLGGASANAMPFGLLPGAPPDVMSVSMGCGPGWTLRPYRHSHPHYAYRRYYQPHYYGYYDTSDLPMRELQLLWNDP
jgi:hypothetical protein